MAQAFGLIFVGGPAVGAAWVSLPHSDSSSPAVSVALLLAAALGAVLLWAGARLSLWAYPAVITFTTVAISAAWYATGDPGAGGQLMYLWATPYAFWFFSARQAVFQATLTAVGSAVALAALAPDRSVETLVRAEYLGTWLLTVSTIVVVGLLVRWLARSLQRSGDRLARGVAAQSALAELGQLALAGTDVTQLFHAAVELGCEGVRGATHATLFHLDSISGEVTLVASRGWDEKQLPSLTASSGRDSQAGYTALALEPVVSSDLTNERRFASTDLVEAFGLRSGVTVPIRGRGLPFGVLGVHSTERRTYTPDEVSLLTSIANVLASALEREAIEKATRHAALHDPLTGLPNRTLFLDRLQQALHRAQRTGRPVGVLLIDLDGFKIVNDSLGHAAGDELLIALAPRLSAALRPGDTVARLGGDEFVIVCGDLATDADVIKVAERIRDTWARAIVVGNTPLYISGSIGISVARGGDATPDALLREADAAMYRAKERGRGHFDLYDAQMRAGAVHRLELEGQLRGAADRGELRLLYQPLLDLVTNEVIGAEALLRWHHPERGLISPADFIPLAEDTGLIVPIGSWVLRQACAQAAAWLESFPGKPVSVTVNVSPRQLAAPGFVAEVTRLIQEAGLPARAIGLEITENVLMDGSAETLDVLLGLKDAGARLLLDDFGTGYSSLGYLKRFPLDALKLDRSFIADLGGGSEGLAIVTAIVGMAQALGLVVVAEGVERLDQQDHLRGLGCQLGQGFLWSQPLAAEVLTAFLAGMPDHQDAGELVGSQLGGR